MNSLRHFPLGAPFPDSPHAVVCSLPTMNDVRGYEEKDPRVLGAMTSGYPRFVVHAYVERLIAFYLDREALSGYSAVLVPSLRAVDDLLAYAGEGALSLPMDDGLYLVYWDPCGEKLSERIRKYVQHTGCGVSSRQAEDLLLSYGRLDAIHSEQAFEGNAEAEVERQLAQLCGCRVEDVFLCASGMNAFYAGFRAVQDFQRQRGRTHWLQLGWLYLDSGCVLKEFLGEAETLEYCYDVSDAEAVIAAINASGDSLAAVVVECPTNPLVQVCDLKRVAAVVRKSGGVLMVDPTVASVYNVDVLPYADILVNSLTKYAAYEGDVMSGSLAINANSPYYGDLALRTSGVRVSPYRRDAQRLAYEMQSAPEIVARMNRNAAALAEFLQSHPAVQKVHYAGQAKCIAGLAKVDGAHGAIISIELEEGALETFYNHIAVMKGPSFGTRFTLISPFMYLAHYDLVTDIGGRDFLRGIGIDPELIRISVGTEPLADLKAVFAEALDAVVSRLG